MKANMTSLFDQFCDMVERGRNAGNAPAFCAAYLINREKITRQQAVSKVMEQVRIFYFF
uniref:Glutaminase n=1 Tax=Heterorhabditis bacteriophora TaxID=37862 RepID=A0A1I7X5Q2_HETBA